MKNKLQKTSSTKPVPVTLFKGNLTPEDIELTLSKTKLDIITPAIQTKIDQTWQVIFNKATSEGKEIYDGDLYFLKDISLLKNTPEALLSLHLGIVKYSTLAYVKQVFKEIKIIPFKTKIGYTAGTVQTADGLYILTELSDKSMNENKHNMLGGLLEPINQPFQKGEYLFASYLQELEEEIGITADDIIQNNLKIIFQNNINNICFYFETKLNIDSTEIARRFKKNTDIGTADLTFHSRDEYIKMLRKRDTNYAFIAEHLTI